MDLPRLVPLPLRFMRSVPQHPTPPPPKRLIAVGSGRGGTGKSTVSLSLAYALATEHGRRVAWIDADPQASGSSFIGLRPAAAPLTAEPEPRSGIIAFPGGEALGGASADQLHGHFTRALEVADVVVVDLSPALTDAAHTAVLSYPATLILTVVNTEPGSLAPAARLVALARAASIPRRVVANQLERDATSTSVLLVLEQLYREELSRHTLRRHRLAKAALMHRMPLTKFRPSIPPSRAVYALSEDLVLEGLA